MDPHVLKSLNAERRARRAAILVTDLGDGRDRVVREGDAVAGTLGEALDKAFRTGKSQTAEAEGRSFFLNVHLPPPRIVAIGAVHISQALAPMARIAGFDIEIVDPRTAFATPERFGDVPLYAEWPQDMLARRPLDAFTALAALTHDPKIDDFPLAAALRAGCFYVGALGSRKTHGKRIERLLADGLTQAQIDRIEAPIGMDISASSPAEIAVAVLAQIIQALRTRGLARQDGVAA
ncbi:XdhC family protein [Mesorhizobium microcysteis]|jgi:xanthine dehydrogenase accessory factor|uniref:XdhC family protein n=1 Tax=Neoaquamicrobium microcysteis TaxID=2682781 RepID=A0A5D4GRU5_9HYPH|nr:XdhC family protein [Mesorhizobium microcysteis]TYR31097.1 XdhC family protein [Mesorhizobium microcysteis]